MIFFSQNNCDIKYMYYNFNIKVLSQTCEAKVLAKLMSAKTSARAVSANGLAWSSLKDVGTCWLKLCHLWSQASSPYFTTTLHLLGRLSNGARKDYEFFVLARFWIPCSKKILIKMLYSWWIVWNICLFFLMYLYFNFCLIIIILRDLFDKKYIIFVVVKFTVMIYFEY